MNQTNLYRLIGSIARQSTTSVNQQVSHLGLDNNLFVYLMRIVENEGLSQAELVERVRIDKTTLSRALKKLVAEGYVRKVPDAHNKKFRRLYATDKGKAIYPQVSQIEQAYIQQALSGVDEAEQTELQTLLAKIYANL
ncbi:MarR family winged helix-turn-helix transcriptional regulator [Pediococcus siamensis]|uniref:MarR family winged helix-turn-helix transcriptional regulator n=1 Tax=Pediococcus siamensis TaxID=381829 RepID=UPI0039A1E3BB